MKQVSTGYKNQIKEMGREIDSIIRYYNHYQIITENNKYILTEDGQKLLTEQIKEDSYIDITAEDIYSVKIITHGDLLKTMMKELDFEIKQNMKIGSIVSYKFGLKVNGEYEYVDYGTFIVNEKEYNEDTQTYSYIAYDKMLFTMVPYKEQDVSEFIGPYTLYDLADYCCQYCGLSLGVESFPNGEREITSDTLNILKDSGFTFRDVLDFITEVSACSSYILGNDFVINTPQETNYTLYEDSFKDTNVIFNILYGPINSILFSRGDDTDFVEFKDNESIAENGVTQIKISNNPFLEGDDRSDYFEEMFDVLGGLTYTINELSLTGVTYLEYLDKFDVSIGDNIYPCLLLNDEITIEQGLEEEIFTEELEEATHEYATSRLSDKDEKWANIHVRKDLAQINLEVGNKVGNDEIISKINLSPEEIMINSNKVSLAGKTIELTSDNINIESNNFSVDNEGHLACSNATITGGNITIPEGLGYGVEVYATSSNVLYNTRQRAGGFSCFRDNKLLARLHDGSSGGEYGVLQLNDSTENTRLSANGNGRLRIYNSNYVTTLNFMGNDSSGNLGGMFEVYDSSGTRTIYLYGPTGYIWCNRLDQGSVEKIKKNFEKFSNAVDIVKDTDIYKYNYKFEEDTAKKHVGIIIGDKYKYSKEIVNENNDGVELYSMISVLWQAVKEQQKEIEELKERVSK